MRNYLTPLFIMLAIAVLGHEAWPFLKPHISELKDQLNLFTLYCHQHALISYSIYALTLCVILLCGVPVATAVMLLAGVTYQFWEAAALITLCRLTAAALAFGLARSFLNVGKPAGANSSSLLRKLEQHPNIGLFLARLAPLPDSLVNYTVAASPIGQRDYVLVSLAGMIPFTLCCAWFGHQLGNVSALMNLIG